MGSGFPRALSDRERRLLDFLLAPDFVGAAQARTVRTRGLHANLATIVLLEVVDPAAPRATGQTSVPVETRVRGKDSPHEVLLVVKDGLLESIELVAYGDVHR